MKRQYKIRDEFKNPEYPDFISFDLFENDKRVGGGGLLSSKEEIITLKQSLEKKGYKEIKV